MPVTAERQFEAGQPWDLTGTPDDNVIKGGHAVVVISRTANGGELVTWGHRQAFTWSWWARYAEESYVAITPAQVAKNGTGYGLNLDQLQADLTRLHLWHW